jgi:ATPase
MRKFDKSADVELLSDSKVVVRVENDVIPILIGKEGRTIKQLEEKLGIHIEVSPKIATMGKEIPFGVEETGAYLVFSFSAKLFNKIANFYIDERYLFSATIGKKGEVKVNKDSDIGKEVLKALVNKELKVFI